MSALRAGIEAALADATPGEPSPRRLSDAMRYSLLAPAKRARAILTELSARHLGAAPGAAMAGACALEMVHASSLVLDDLPAMDDAALRRGQPTAHRKFGEATAVLAAIGLMNNAYRIVAADQSLPLDRRVRVLGTLARAIGTDGLTGGQEADLHGVDQTPGLTATAQAVAWIHARKTGALFAAATEIGAVVAGLSADEDLSRMHEFGMQLGLAFQAYDDLLDARASVAAVGKDIGRDDSKATLVGLLGFDAALANADAQMQAARVCVPDIDRPGSQLARYIDALTHMLRQPLGVAARPAP